MRRSLWIAAVAVLLTAGPAPAQVMLPIQARFGPQTSLFFQARTGPYSGFTYYARGYGFPPAWHGPGWFPAQPPIIIQNINQPHPPVPILVGPNRAHVIPAEFEEPAPRPVAGAPKLGPAPKRADVAVVPEIARPRAANRADADRLVETGRSAFADGQYGRALERFRRAAEITPNEPSAHYLVSQAHFALGKYREAVAAIAAGMAVRADWSDARFHSRDLYGPKPAAFDQHLTDLRRAVEAFPEDATLLFLLGHQLWFDGKHEEAMPLILKARAAGKDQTPAAAFVLK